MTATLQPQSGLPPIHRLLTPDEFEQMRQMSPEAIAATPLPALPPLAPKDAVRRIDPNSGAPDTPVNMQAANALAKSSLGTSPGLPGILTRQLALPIMEHPYLTAAGVVAGGAIPGAGWVFSSLMAKDVAEYAAQKAAEHSLPPDVRALAERDPTRISGERAGVEAALMLAGPVVGSIAKGLGKGGRPAPESSTAPLDTAEPTTLTPEKAAQVQQAIQVGNAVRASKPVIDAHMDAVSDAIKTISPQVQTENIIRANAGQAAAVKEQAYFKLDEFRRSIDHLPLSDQLGFTDAIEGGESQPTPEFQKPADYMRTALDAQLKRVQGLGTGALDNYIENYFPHAWEDPERAATAFESSRASLAAKAPFEGSKASLKQRTIPTTLDGIQLGLKPKFDNPVDLFLYRLADMEKYITAHRSLNEMKDAGLAKFYSGIGPDGWKPIDDKVATVFGPREGAVTLPEGANVEPGDVGVLGRRIMGKYWAPKEAANTINNYLSPGLAQTLRNTVPGKRGEVLAQTYDVYRQMGNTLNQAQLGLSAFHVGTTALNSVISRTALGLEYMKSGQLLQGAGEVASAPAAPIGNFMLGRQIKAAYLNPSGASPEMSEFANAVADAGGRIGQDSFYKGSYPEKMFDAWRQGDYGKAAGLSVPALFEAASRPIMEHIVPLEKLGAFGDLAQKALAELPVDATLADRRAALSGAWDSVDNRFGQLVYDNLFWNKVTKDLAMASTRSVGWNLGTIREVGGGASDLLHGEFSHRAAYAVSLPMTIGLYGAIYQLLRTGEAPSELKDYYYPKTGSLDPDGNPDRVQLPSYAKDVVSYATHPVQTVQHKMAPLLSGIMEMLSNQDFYGDEIRNPNDPFVKQIGQEASYVGKMLEPFSFRNAAEQKTRGDTSPATKIGNWFGITPAPRAAVQSPAEQMMAAFNSTRTVGTTPEDADARKTRSDLLGAIRTHQNATDIEQKVTAALEAHKYTSADIGRLLKRAGMTPAEEQFKRLTVEQAVAVFQAASGEEKLRFAQLLNDKLDRASKR